MNVEEILEERGNQYGEFKGIAVLAQVLKGDAMSFGKNWSNLNHSQREALHMVLHKIARIVNMPADSEAFKDQVVDIVGYMKIGFPECFDEPAEEGS